MLRVKKCRMIETHTWNAMNSMVSYMEIIAFEMCDSLDSFLLADILLSFVLLANSFYTPKKLEHCSTYFSDITSFPSSIGRWKMYTPAEVQKDTRHQSFCG